MDNKKWYKRLLFSHFAILFITGAFISSVVFAVTYGNLAADTEKANRTYTEHVVDGMTTSLKNIELMLVNQIVSNEAINNFFNGQAGESKLVEYKASSEIAKIRRNPLIHSVYFYRNRDRTVLTGGYIARLADFPDKQFVLDLQSKPRTDHWSPVRTYTEFPLIDPSERVISITKSAAGNQGIIVLNVKADPLLSMAGKSRSGTRDYMNIADEEGHPIYATGPSASGTKPLTRMNSEYIGWQFTSGTAGANLIAQAARLSLLPLTLVLLCLAAIVVIIMVVARRNYRPIENMVRRVSIYRNETEAAASDEFSIIERAFDTMLTRMDLIDRQQAEGKLLAGRRQFFFELQDDEKTLSAEEWGEYARLLRLPDDPRGLVIAIVEIDKYVPQLRRDRQELQGAKKRLESEIQQGMDEGAKALCLDWISVDRLALLVKPEPAPERDTSSVLEMLDKLRTRVGQELVFSITIGIGSEAGDLPGVKTSFREALAALQYKMTAGSNRMIVYREIRDKENGIESVYFKWLEDMVHHFRMPSPAWEADFARIFDHLEKRVLKNDELQLLLNYLTHRFAREMEEISPAINEYWHSITLPRMSEALRDTGTMKEIRELYESLIRELFGQYAAMLESGSSIHQIYDVKKYIEDNYANPDLSLNHISDRFGMNGKYASQLFKEEFGIKFVDFLIGLRIRQAQTLLRETETSIHEISRLVGYEHAISFGRIFKKTVGVSPGDYRRMMQRGRSLQES